MATEFIQYKGKKILYGDYRGIKDQKDMLKTLELASKLMKETPGKFLLLTDLTDCVIGKEFFRNAKELGADVIKDKAEKHAIIGVTGMKGIVVKGYAAVSKDNIKVFDSETEAKEYLIT
jgi:hypothetical protein